ncbi:MAG: PQQ-dependent sugar dehydrogenase [bacterium]|nr:PQQ-dependent sugar dehydrogenase [bacterium]
MKIPLSLVFQLMILYGLIAPTVSLADDNPSDNQKRDQYLSFALENAGNADRGEALFQHATKTACANCHAIHGIEKSGPNLDGIADKYPRAELIRHIIDPNLFIQPGYETATVLTESGEVVTGRIRLSTRLEVRLLLADGKLRSIKRANIASFKSTNRSMMPDNLIDTISPQEFADLVAYLDTLHASELNALVDQGREIQIHPSPMPVAVTPLHEADLNFRDPVWVTEIPGHSGQLVVLEHQQGLAQRLDMTTSPPTKHLFLDLSQEITFSPNQGLMCLAFHPKYSSNGKYYVKYEVQRADGSIWTTINERIASADRLGDSGTPSRLLLEQFQPAFNHNGGCLAFGPDNYLYIAFGDGGPQKDPPGYSQNPAVFHGSMLRIDVDRQQSGLAYAIPSDNPFAASAPNGHSSTSASKPTNLARKPRAETWAYGFREPWRFSFDQQTGELWLGDVGQVKFEEVCLVRRGENHGWNVFEGFSEFSNQYRRSDATYTSPILAYPRALGVSVTGGYVYRGNPQSPWYGCYIFGDYESRKIWALRMQDNQVQEIVEIANIAQHIASFGTDAQGNILIVGYEGTIWKLDL